MNDSVHSFQVGTQRGWQGTILIVAGLTLLFSTIPATALPLTNSQTNIQREAQLASALLVHRGQL